MFIQSHLCVSFVLLSGRGFYVVEGREPLLCLPFQMRGRLGEEEFAARYGDTYGSLSEVNSDAVGPRHFKLWSEFEYHDVVLNAGDCFYLPARWTHVVKAPPAQRSVSFNIWAQRHQVEQPYAEDFCAKMAAASWKALQKEDLQAVAKSAIGAENPFGGSSSKKNRFTKQQQLLGESLCNRGALWRVSDCEWHSAKEERDGARASTRCTVMGPQAKKDMRRYFQEIAVDREKGKTEELENSEL